MIGDARGVAGAIVRHRQEPADAARRGRRGLHEPDAFLQEGLAQEVRIQQIGQRLVKVEGGGEATAVPAQIAPG